jgi:hypothetical protein
MKEPQRIKLSPETPTPKEPHKYRLPPLDKPEWDISGQDNDDIYVQSELDEINKKLDKINCEDNS